MSRITVVQYYSYSPCSLWVDRWNALARLYVEKSFTRARLQMFWGIFVVFSAQQSSEYMFSCLSPQHIEKQDAHRAVSPVSFHFFLTLSWLPLFPPPTNIPLFVCLIILPRLHCFSQSTQHKLRLFRDVVGRVVSRLIFLKLIPGHYIWELCCLSYFEVDRS